MGSDLLTRPCHVPRGTQARALEAAGRENRAQQQGFTCAAGLPLGSRWVTFLGKPLQAIPKSLFLETDNSKHLSGRWFMG